MFDPSERPWINAKGATTNRIIEQVHRCPTGALTYFYNDEEKKEGTEPVSEKPEIRIEIMKNGPAIIKGKSITIAKDGKEKTYKSMVSMCRCGKSNNKPLCDGSHFGDNFE